MRAYFRGRKRQKVYQYDKEGKFIRSYETIADARKEFYNDVNGVYPMFRDGADYHILPDDTVLVKERIGREGIVHMLNVINNPLVYEEDDVKPFTIYNISGEPVASFINIKAATVLTDMTYQQIYNHLNYKRKDNVPVNKLKITIKYDDIEE